MSTLLNLEEERPQGLNLNFTQQAAPLEPDPELIARAKRGANWFYWIAALSVINSIALIAGANFQFIVGLGVTQIIGGLAQAVANSADEGAAAVATVFGIIFDLVALIGFALTGYFANKLFQTAFIVGIVVYILDGLIVLLLGDYLMTAFHAYALIWIIRGYLACRELKAFIKANTVATPITPQPPEFA
jgi:hypothetical protein